MILWKCALFKILNFAPEKIYLDSYVGTSTSDHSAHRHCFHATHLIIITNLIHYSYLNMHIAIDYGAGLLHIVNMIPVVHAERYALQSTLD